MTTRFNRNKTKRVAYGLVYQWRAWLVLQTPMASRDNSSASAHAITTCTTSLGFWMRKASSNRLASLSSVGNTPLPLQGQARRLPPKLRFPDRRIDAGATGLLLSWLFGAAMLAKSGERIYLNVRLAWHMDLHDWQWCRAAPFGVARTDTLDDVTWGATCRRTGGAS